MSTPAPIEINKTFDVERENQKYLMNISIKDKKLNIKITKINSIPGKYFL